MADYLLYWLTDLLPGSWRIAYVALFAISLNELSPTLRLILSRHWSDAR